MPVKKHRQKQIRKLKARLLETSHTANSLRKRVSAQSVEIAQLKKQRQNGLTRLKSSQADSQAKSDELAALRTQVDQIRVYCSKLQDKLAASDERNIYLQAELEKLEYGREQLSTDLARRLEDKTVRLKALKSKLDSVGGEQSRMRQQLEDRHSRALHDLQASHRKTVHNLKAAFRSKLVEYQNHVARTLSQAVSSGRQSDSEKKTTAQTLPNLEETSKQSSRIDHFSISQSVTWSAPPGRHSHSQAQIVQLQRQVAVLQEVVKARSEKPGQPELGSDKFVLFSKFLSLADWVRRNTPST